VFGAGVRAGIGAGDVNGDTGELRRESNGENSNGDGELDCVSVDGVLIVGLSVDGVAVNEPVSLSELSDSSILGIPGGTECCQSYTGLFTACVSACLWW
jgi:hypothetical protein